MGTLKRFAPKCLKKGALQWQRASPFPVGPHILPPVAADARSPIFRDVAPIRSATPSPAHLARAQYEQHPFFHIFFRFSPFTCELFVPHHPTVAVES